MRTLLWRIPLGWRAALVLFSPFAAWAALEIAWPLLFAGRLGGPEAAWAGARRAWALAASAAPLALIGGACLAMVQALAATRFGAHRPAGGLDVVQRGALPVHGVSAEAALAGFQALHPAWLVDWAPDAWAVESAWPVGPGVRVTLSSQGGVARYEVRPIPRGVVLDCGASVRAAQALERALFAARREPPRDQGRTS